ncbi:uncharacterized protein LOC142530374 [Primulina tabacum]|uniref:uncharacterized protein LOC142530374 n=1 Tax=Primulina tabacum TaxID=48773 RepID=UPI003F5AB725
MASLFFTAATLSYATTNTIPRLSVAKSTFLVTTRKLQPHYVVYPPSIVTWAFAGGNPRNTPVADNDGDEDREPDTNDTSLVSENQEDNIEVEIETTGKNSRRIRSKIVVQANLQTLWEVLTDYERLADFIPGLVVSQLLEKGDNFARLFQIGQQDLALGLKFNAKGGEDKESSFWISLSIPLPTEPLHVTPYPGSNLCSPTSNNNSPSRLETRKNTCLKNKNFKSTLEGKCHKIAKEVVNSPHCQTDEPMVVPLNESGCEMQS